MNYLLTNKSIRFLLFGIFAGCVFLPLGPAKAQCVVRQPLTVPMWEIYGINPYHPQVRTATTFTPLQYSYSNFVPTTNTPVAILPPTAIVGEVYLGEFSLDEIPSVETFAKSYPDLKLESPDMSSVIIVEPEIEAVVETEPGSIPSPSDIVIVQPLDPATVQPSQASNEIRDARAEIERLRIQLEEAKATARAATERAYAAEKTAVAANENAERRMTELKTLAANQVKGNIEAAAESEMRQKEAAEIALQLDKAKADAMAQLENAKAKMNDQRVELQRALEIAQLEAALADRNRKESARQSSTPATQGGARELVRQLEADAKTKRKSSPDKANAEQEKSDKAESDNPNQGKRNRSNVDEQIKNLSQSMERQIKKSSEQINNRAQAKIDQLVDEGKKSTDQEIIDLKEKMQAEIQENEAKIRQRIEQRIERIKKEAADRAKN